MPSAATSVSNTASVKGELGFCACFYFIVNKEKYFFFSMSFFLYRLGRYFRTDLLLLLILLLLKWWPYLFLLKTAYHVTQAVTPALCLPLISVKNATSVKCANCFFLLSCASFCQISVEFHQERYIGTERD